MAGIFKAYDVRGLYPEGVDRAVAEKIGRAFAAVKNVRNVVVGRDMRVSSDELFAGLSAGLSAAGVNVTDLGKCSTPILYHAVGTLKADGGVMITASHNPGGWNGFKLCLANAVPLGITNGLKEIESAVNAGDFADAPVKGAIRQIDMTAEYGKFVRQFAKFDGKKLKVVCDFGNGMGSIEIAGIRDLFDVIPMYEEPDGTFPNHEANPLKTETLKDICAKVRETGAAFGAAFDGDADRCGFVDETGRVISMDLFTALIACDVLRSGPATILYDLRSSHAVPECIAENGGTPMMTPVGHSFIKKKMRETGAAFAGELSGHYYFRENFCAESQALAMVKFANLLCRTGKKASELVAPLRRYHSTGELNYKVEDIPAILDRVRKTYSGKGEWFELDGVSGEYGSWRFNLRASNTEPLLRLIVEADTAEKMTEERDRLLSVILKKN